MGDEFPSNVYDVGLSQLFLESLKSLLLLNQVPFNIVLYFVSRFRQILNKWNLMNAYFPNKVPCAYVFITISQSICLKYWWTINRSKNKKSLSFYLCNFNVRYSLRMSRHVFTFSVIVYSHFKRKLTSQRILQFLLLT